MKSTLMSNDMLPNALALEGKKDRKFEENSKKK